MTAHDITRRLIADRMRACHGAGGRLLPRYTPKGWWECDLFELTKSGYFREYEIKLTLSDFRADAAKKKTKWTLDSTCMHWQQVDLGTKHGHLGRANPDGPRQFWYVTPSTMVIPDGEFPIWAGLITAMVNPHAAYKMTLLERRPAPILHSIKSKITLGDIHETSWWRFIRLYIREQQG